MILKPIVYDGGLQRQVAVGDVVGGAEVIPASLSANALTLTGAIMANGIVARNPSAAGSVTVDSAANIIAALSGGLNLTAIQSGSTFRLKWINNSGFTDTLAATANTGVTVSFGVVNASCVKDFLVTIVNGSPVKGTLNTLAITNASAVVTGLVAADAMALTPGMVVTSAVAGLQGATVLGVNLTNNSVTLSVAANATLAFQALTFSPVLTIVGIGQGLL